MSRMVSRVFVFLFMIAALAIQPGTQSLVGQVANAEVTLAANGLKPGDPVGTFRVIKIAGCEEDGVEVGQSLCYRCRYGSNPMVIVFARESSDKLDPLVNALEKSLEAHEEKKLSAFVVAVGDDRSKLKEDAVALIKRTGAKRIPAVVTEDSTSGPLDYHLSSASDVTVVVAKDSQVFAQEILDINKIEPKSIIDQIEAMLAP